MPSPSKDDAATEDADDGARGNAACMVGVDGIDDELAVDTARGESSVVTADELPGFGAV